MFNNILHLRVRCHHSTFTKLMSTSSSSSSSSSSSTSTYTTIPGVLQLGDPMLRLTSRPIKACDLINKKRPVETALHITGAGRPVYLEEQHLLHEKLESFRTTMGYGRGIAAAQIGKPIRLIALHLGDTHKDLLSKPELGFDASKPISLWNPEISFNYEGKFNNNDDSDTFTLFDDCMSFPHLMVKIKRYKTCNVKFWTVVQLPDVIRMDKVVAQEDQYPYSWRPRSNDSHHPWRHPLHCVVEIEWNNLPMDIAELMQHEMDHLEGVLAIDHVKEENEETDIIDRNEYLHNLEMYNGLVDYQIVPTV